MKQLTILILSLIFICSQAAFIEQGDLTNNMKRTKFPDFISPFTEQIGVFDNDMMLFDLVQYNDKGDWATIMYSAYDQAVILVFYDVQGNKIAQHILGGEYFNKNEGDLGVSLTTTNKSDEIFVSLTREQKIGIVDVVGAIIGVDGKFKRSESWVTIFSSTTDYNYARPEVLKCGQYIYVIAYVNGLQYNEFQGDGRDEQRRILDSPPSQTQTQMGNLAFNYIDISGSYNLQSPSNLEGTIIEFFDAEETSRVYVDFNQKLQIVSLGGTKAAIVFHDNQNSRLVTSNPDQIIYLLIDNAVPQLPQVFDNTVETYPNEEQFDTNNTIIDLGVIPNTQNIVLTYANRGQSLFISTINTVDNSTVCHKSYTENYEYFTQLFDGFNNRYHPTILIESATLGYISINFNNMQGEDRFFMLQFNPTTCEFDTNITIPYEVQSNSIRSYKYQKMIFVTSKSLNEHRIAHLGVEEVFERIALTLIKFQTMYNCDQKDETNNVCTSCQLGYALTLDGQCITPNCAMDCEQFDQFCNMETFQCQECFNHGHCTGNSKGNICLNNMCQNNCYSNEDCSIEGKQCNTTTNQCTDITLSQTVEKIELPVPETIPIIEANNKITGNLELEFSVIDPTDFTLEYLKLTMDNSDVFPINVISQNKTIFVTLPRNTSNGQKTFKLYANKLTPTNSSQRRNLASGFNTEQVYMEKTVEIIDTENQIKQIETITTIATTKDEVIAEQKKEIDDSDDGNTAYYVLIPIMVIGFIGFAVGGFFLGKKQSQQSTSQKNTYEQNDQVKTKTEGI